MEHGFIDKYAGLDSPIHRLDPRIKVICLTLFIFFVIFTRPPNFSLISTQPWLAVKDSLKFLFYFLLIFSVILLSRIPLKFMFKKSLVVVPFVLLVAIFIPFSKEGEIAGSYNFAFLNLNITYNGLTVLFNVLSKSWLSVLSMAVLTSTTKFPTLLKAFERLKMPKVMLMIISFMYRYIFVITDEMMSMKRARDSRAFGGSIVWHTKTAGAIIGTLFVRSYERAERVYLAMASRGFTGTIKVLEDFKISKLDFLFSIPFFFCLVFIHIWPVL